MILTKISTNYNQCLGTSGKTNGNTLKTNEGNGNDPPLISHAHVHHLYGQQKVHRLGRRRSSNKLLSIKNGAKQKQSEEPVALFATSQEQDRIWPIPEPNVIVICYSVVDPTSFLAVGNEIISELNERFPNVPRILVATKDDLKESNMSNARSVGAELTKLNISSTINEKEVLVPSVKSDTSLSADSGKFLDLIKCEVYKY